jgi:hypothetical protein
VHYNRERASTISQHSDLPIRAAGGQVLEQKMLHGKERPRIHPMVLLHKTMPISFAVLVPVVSCVQSRGRLWRGLPDDVSP